MSSSNSTSPASRPNSPMPEWSSGNFTITSSDGVDLKIEDYHLRSASTVFRDMIESGTDGPLKIEFTDPDFETADIVARFLNIIVNAQVASGSWRMSDHVQLGQLLKKYDCAAAITVLALHIGQGYGGGIRSFILGAALDDADICTSALRPPFDKWEDSPHKRKKGEGKDALGNTRASKGSHFNTQTLPMEWVALIPLDYRWALDRAFLTVGDHTDLPLKFALLLQDAKATKV
ncbi:hypothetical protein Q8F55_002748 [Vanrija albida]|uniref:BTB domain-containing protein n=1 Tax=Vanrija albida TaxID=181172 RepID=A0ABR3QBN2_9TREE